MITGIAFDIVGVAATKANERPFHAMATKKVPGSRKAIQIVRNADRVANFCNDVVGDICGTLSGAIGAGIVFRLLTIYRHLDEDISAILMTALVAALTVSGKAFGKGFAMDEATGIVVFIGRQLEWLERVTGLRFFENDLKASRRRKFKNNERRNNRSGGGNNDSNGNRIRRGRDE